MPDESGPDPGFASMCPRCGRGLVSVGEWCCGSFTGPLTTMRSAVNDVLHGTTDDTAAIQAAIDHAHYEPTGLILHPLDHATVSIDPADSETVEAAKRVADAFGVPYWTVGIPGYRPPLRVRARVWVRRLPRRVLSAVPGVTYRGYTRATGNDWYDDTPTEPRAWKWGAYVGRYRIGTPAPEPEEDW